MAWGTTLTSTSLSLTGSYQIVQRSAADWEIALDTKEVAQVLMDYNPTDTSPSENCQIVIETSPDGTNWETIGEAQGLTIEYSNIENDDPAIRSESITGVANFRIKARLRTPTGGVGGADSGSTLTVLINTDGN